MKRLNTNLNNKQNDVSLLDIVRHHFRGKTVTSKKIVEKVNNDPVTNGIYSKKYLNSGILPRLKGYYGSETIQKVEKGLYRIN
ncbi:hypothetical protein GF336_02975 [Candidatus Woesearchaeota archaeon]|nr:hypothetical protein [Candidatus Woesearchaeota archaeon]